MGRMVLWAEGEPFQKQGESAGQDEEVAEFGGSRVGGEAERGA